MNAFRRMLGVVCGAAMLFSGGIQPAVAAEKEAPQPIGVPDLPRRIKYQFPDSQRQQEIKLGIFRLHPSFQTSVQYDDNVTLAPDNEQDDTLFTQIPALEAQVKMGDHSLEAAYGAEIINYVDQSDENAVNHMANGAFNMNFDNLSVVLSHAFEDTTNRTFSENSTRDHLKINSSEATARYDRPRWAAEGTYRHNDLNHETAALNNSDMQEDFFALLTGYKILPKILALIEGDVGLINYDNNVSEADQSYYQLWTGLRGDLTSKLTTITKVGYHNRQMDDVPGLSQQEDYSGLVAHAELAWQPERDTGVRFIYDRAVKNSTFATDNWYRQDKVSLSLRQRFWNKWIATPLISWQSNVYPDLDTVGTDSKHRRDNFWQAEASLRYEMQEWLSSGFTYAFRNRDSSFSTLDYDNNRFTFDVTAVF